MSVGSKNNFTKWLPVIGLAFSTFIFNTSEFIPIGLLSDIAKDFKITESQAGMMITIYAWVVAIASLPLMLLFARAENKKLMLGIVALFTVSHIFSSIATSFNFLVLSRVGVACSHAIFWSIVPPLAVRLAPEGKGASALGLTVTGSSIAMIMGIPIGRIIGLYVGWRTTFLIIGAFAAFVFLLLLFVLKKTPSDNAITLRKLPALLKSRGLLAVYIMTILIVTGQFTGYSYIEPFLGQVAGLSPIWVTIVLCLFGVTGLVINFLFSRYFDTRRDRFITTGIVVVCLSLALLRVSALAPVTVIILCFFWGLAINSYNLSFNAQIINLAPQGTAVAMSVFSGLYNFGIGTGALVGGAVCSDLGIANIGYVGFAIALFGAIHYFRNRCDVLGIPQKSK